MVKNLPAMQETRVQSLNWEEFHGQKNLADCSPWSHKEVDVTEATEHAACTLLKPNLLKKGWIKTMGFQNVLSLSLFFSSFVYLFFSFSLMQVCACVGEGCFGGVGQE